ncbi:2,4'-dihydroxyacetophenone dioxygenase family protein [Propioniferax innocua]|uniref:2,4'-dihydroxyacetophenone dioxygenase n=1 Tax=Propioniferax innocua TaxID=1753 RepID=A0A542ZCK6_9ACTN|nr:2,4'-dihydroxyacetophenone dioxygenase family protein [Propioniferax innocua]TQL57980.1 2,4'-dihydroxyacetophenone dioxygenase [Propioniferax innocua]
MPEEATTEFWRGIKPIENYSKPGSLPEVHIPNAADLSDERYFAPLSDTAFSRPLWINVQQNMWADVLMAKEAGLVNRHYHPQEVFAWTISGKWAYLEYDWTATAGSFVYETPGGSHTLVAYESDEPMRVHFVVKGPLIWLDENGESIGHFDVFDYIQVCKEHYEKVGLGAHLIDELTR